MAVVLIGTLDTKGHELHFVRELLRARGVETLVIDAGALGPPSVPCDIPSERVFAAGGMSLDHLRAGVERAVAIEAAARGVAILVQSLQEAGRVDAILSIGGSGGTTIGTAAMRALPFGIPKVMVSTLASGQVRPFVAGSDIFMLHSVADIAGLNRLTTTVLANAANAVFGMVSACIGDRGGAQEKPLIGATMFGVTTPCVDRARHVLEDAGCEVLVFHATGVGGQAMEGLARDGKLAAVLDLTTTELADEHVGGILSAGPDRLRAAGRAGIPQVVSVGALDMVNFGPRHTVPDRFGRRKFHVHNENVTLMRTTPEECAAIGARMASSLGEARGPVILLLPLGGISAIDVPGHPFHDPEADAALFDALRRGLAGHPRVQVVERPEAINAPSFADAAAQLLLRLIGVGTSAPSIGVGGSEAPSRNSVVPLLPRV
ncbi:MAG: Tm-1-like ATP-binding domain-containing protein [Isosphaeraceae bacterium]